MVGLLVEDSVEDEVAIAKHRGKLVRVRIRIGWPSQVPYVPYFVRVLQALKDDGTGTESNKLGHAAITRTCLLNRCSFRFYAPQRSGQALGAQIHSAAHSKGRRDEAVGHTEMARWWPYANEDNVWRMGWS